MLFPLRKRPNYILTDLLYKFNLSTPIQMRKILLKKYKIKRPQNLLFAPRSVIILTNAEIFHTQQKRTQVFPQY
jgi:hypothetical protein